MARSEAHICTAHSSLKLSKEIRVVPEEYWNV